MQITGYRAFVKGNYFLLDLEMLLSLSFTKVNMIILLGKIKVHKSKI